MILALLSILGCTAPEDTAVASPITWTECGYYFEEHPCDFTLKDQDGKDWNLYEHYGSPIVVDFSTMWCSICVTSTATINAMTLDYASKDLVWVTVLIEDSSGNPVDVEDVKYWSTTYNMTTPILVGDRSFIDLSAETGYPIAGFPTIVGMTDEMVLELGIVGWSEELIRTWIETQE